LTWGDLEQRLLGIKGLGGLVERGVDGRVVDLDGGNAEGQCFTGDAIEESL
jgi:hypothetical protein